MEKSKKTMEIGGHIYELLFSRKKIAKKITKVAEEIKSDYQGKKPPILLGILNGSLYFLKDLSTKLGQIGFQHELELVRIEKFTEDEVGGMAKLVGELCKSLEGRDIIVVEDVIDTGDSLRLLHSLFKENKNPPNSIEYCLLGRKDCHRPLDFSIKYILFDNLNEAWLVGYGMDSNKLFRWLMDIWVKIN